MRRPPDRSGPWRTARNQPMSEPEPGAAGRAAGDTLVDPVLNGPYDPPQEHFELGADGSPTGAVRPGRRPSESFIPVA